MAYGGYNYSNSFVISADNIPLLYYLHKGNVSIKKFIP